MTSVIEQQTEIDDDINLAEGLAETIEAEKALVTEELRAFEEKGSAATEADSERLRQAVERYMHAVLDKNSIESDHRLPAGTAKKIGAGAIGR